MLAPGDAGKARIPGTSGRVPRSVPAILEMPRYGFLIVVSTAAFVSLPAFFSS